MNRQYPHIYQIDFVLIADIFSYGSLEIKCTSEIYDVYFQSSQMTFVGLGKLINFLSWNIKILKYFHRPGGDGLGTSNNQLRDERPHISGEGPGLHLALSLLLHHHLPLTVSLPILIYQTLALAMLKQGRLDNNCGNKDIYCSLFTFLK